MANDKYHEAIRLGLRTLQRALEPNTTVALDQDTPDGPLQAGWAVFRTADQRPASRLRLAPWQGERDAPVSANTIWVLPRTPKRVVQSLRAEGANFVDPYRGWVRVHAPGLVIDRTDVPVSPRPPSERRLVNPFGDRASLVSRVLASEPGRIWGTRELAQAAGVSTMTASHVVRQLERVNVVLVEPVGRAKRIYLKSLESLIATWSVHYDWTLNRLATYAAPLGDVKRFLRRLSAAFHPHRWALTMHAGAALIAPIAVWTKVHVYLDVHERGALQAIAGAAGWTEAPDGRLVIARPYYRESVWHGARSIGGLPVVSDVQLILDLWSYPDRGREQALHLLQRDGRAESSTT